MRMTGWRSLLFVPATSPQLLAKAVRSGADAVIVDLEDSVAPERKAEARRLAQEAIAAHGNEVPLLLRVNAQPGWLREDLAQAPLDRLQGLMLPKVESAQQVIDVQETLARLGAPQLPIAVLIETARGVLHAERIAAGPNVAALGFGAEDYASEMGVAPQPPSLLWPAQQVATCARAFGQACWGLPGSIAEIADMEAFGALVSQARAVGFTGTVCIHPKQVAVANQGFGPSAAELEWARKVVAADEDAQRRGLGAVQLEGRMIDRPIVERARRWLQLPPR